MHRVAIFVDAGYFFAAGSKVAFSRPLKRHEFFLGSPKATIGALNDKAAEVAGNQHLLRLYWYDAPTGPSWSTEQSTIAHLPGVKMRMGVLNSAGQQKGVDSLIVTDLIDLARNKAVADAVLIAGDEDLRIAVEVAQAFGVRVHVLAVGNAADNVSPALRMAADSVSVLDAEWFAGRFVERPSLPPSAEALSFMAFDPAEQAPDILAIARNISRSMLQERQPEEIRQLASALQNNYVPPEYDRPLMAQTATQVGRRFSGDEMRSIRGVFVRAVRDMASDAAE